MEAIFSQNSPQNRILETPIKHKNSEKGPIFLSKIPERVDIETIKWHTPVRKYHEFPPGPRTSLSIEIGYILFNHPVNVGNVVNTELLDYEYFHKLCINHSIILQ